MVIGLDESVNHIQYDKSKDGISFFLLVIEILIVLELFNQFKHIFINENELLFIDNYGIQ